MTKYVLIALAGAAVASTASAQSILPPDFNLQGGTGTMVHQQVLSGGFNVTGFRLQADAAAASGGGVYQSDIAMTLLAPNGTELNIGPNLGAPAGHLTWAQVPSVGTIPGNSGAAVLIDAVFDYNFGPVDGTWSVSFFHHYTSGGDINWTNISITPIPAPGAFALLGLGGLIAARRRR